MAFELFPVLQWFDNSGNPLNGGKIYTFAASSSTPLATYTDSTGGTPQANPVILDSAGRNPIWFSAASYKLVIKTSADVTLLTVDNITLDNLAATVASLVSTGAVTMQQSNAATSGANQSSNILSVQGSYWNGSASATDQWTVQDVLGAGSNPTSTLAVAHSGSSGAARMTVSGSNVVTASSTDTLTNKTLTGNTAANLVSGAGTLTLNTSGNMTAPNATDTFVGKATTDTLTNKTIDTAGPNTLKVNGNTLSATAGSATVTVPNSTSTLVGVVASTLNKAESGADANLLTYSPPAAIAKYRVSFCLDLSAANSATLGWTITYENITGNPLSPTNLSLFKLGTAAPALTFTTSTASDVFYGSTDITIDSTSTNIVVKLTFSGTSFSGKASATIERLA